MTTMNRIISHLIQDMEGKVEGTQKRIAGLKEAIISREKYIEEETEDLNLYQDALEKLKGLQ